MENMPELWIPLAGIIMTFGSAAVIGSLALYYNYRRRHTLSQEILAAIEKGIEVPFPPPRKRNYYNLGLLWTAVGVALFIAIYVSSRELAGAIWGLLPLAVGAAFLLIARAEKRSDSGDDK